MYLVINVHGSFAAIYFVTLIVFGNFMLLNLFLAILLQQLSSTVDDQAAGDDGDEEEIEDARKTLEMILQTLKNKTGAAQDQEVEPEEAKAGGLSKFGSGLGDRSPGQ